MITIVIVRALGLSGATWFNLVLGSHRDALALGPASRILDLPEEQIDHACLIHHEQCEFWPGFLRGRDHKGKFFKNLERESGKNTFILNYPTKELLQREVFDQGFRVVTVRLVRDGRASLHSHIRHYGNDDTPIFHHVHWWQKNKWDQIDRKMANAPGDKLVVNYEQLLMHGASQMKRIGEVVGLDYPDDAFQFWKYNEHMTAGNTGVIDLVSQMHSQGGLDHANSERYSSIASSLKQDAQYQHFDRTWETELSRDARLVFELVLGERNAKFGYDRDEFSQSELEEAQNRLDQWLSTQRSKN